MGLFSGIKPSKAEPGQTLFGRLVASVVTWSFLFLAVLCAERVGQMTKTYNDIDAVTRLLEEVSDSGKGKESFIIDWL